MLQQIYILSRAEIIINKYITLILNSNSKLYYPDFLTNGISSADSEAKLKTDFENRREKGDSSK